MSAVALDFYEKRCEIVSGFPRSEVRLGSCSETGHSKADLSHLGCGQSACQPVSCFEERVDVKRVLFTSVMMDGLKSRRLPSVMSPIVLFQQCALCSSLYTGCIRGLLPEALKLSHSKY